MVFLCWGPHGGRVVGPFSFPLQEEQVSPLKTYDKTSLYWECCPCGQFASCAAHSVITLASAALRAFTWRAKVFSMIRRSRLPLKRNTSQFGNALDAQRHTCQPHGSGASNALLVVWLGALRFSPLKDVLEPQLARDGDLSDPSRSVRPPCATATCPPGLRACSSSELKATLNRSSRCRMSGSRAFSGGDSNGT